MARKRNNKYLRRMSIFEKSYGSEYSDAITMVHKEFKEAGDNLFNEV